MNNIIRQQDEKLISFFSLKSGDIFLFNDIYYMKAMLTQADDTHCYYAVNLSNGIITYIPAGSQVVPIFDKMVIEKGEIK